MRSINYWHPLIYSFFIKLSYGKANNQRYEAIRDLIDSNSSLVDVCCGDCKIFNYLKEKDVTYLGLDFNPCFIRVANKKGINARLFDVKKDELPKADYILMQGSLYQFIPYHNEIIKKIINAANKYIIICEPVSNKTQSKIKVISLVGKLLSDPGDGIKEFKFNLKTIREALEPYRNNIVKEIILNHIDYIAVLRKQ